MNMRVSCFAFAFLVFAQFACAVDIAGVKWQRGLEKKGVSKRVFEDISWLRIATDNPSVKNLRILVALTNRGDKPVEGSVLRCAFSLRLAKAGAGEGVWTVPFLVEERRVARIKPGNSSDVNVYNIDMKPYLARLKGTGFWPDAVKVQLMVEPRRGDELTGVIYESVLPVSGGPAL